ncbi:hypothetical protein ACM66B_005236 [Microbotryomycetes sp. NB124-2]
MSANSYSALLRRSKLATFTPAIEQVYTPGSAAQLKRQDFGFKHTLPQATTSKAPFVRVNRLDNAQRRTDYRKATREALYVKKWQELGVAINQQRDGEATPLPDLELQSRFVPESMLGSIKPVEAATKAAQASRRVPNFFTMTEDEFERFVDSLGHLRHDFAQFASESLATSSGSAPEPVDLYELAQADPAHVTRLVEQFLARQTEQQANDMILPCTHPTLGLQYSTPTPIDDALAPRVPGRILGQANARNSTATHFATIIGQIDELNGKVSSNNQTQFMPDNQGLRSNQPGRASFRLRPTMDVERIARELNAPVRDPDSAKFASSSHEPQMLAQALIQLHPNLETRPAAPLPGTMEYAKYTPGSARSSSPIDLFGRSLSTEDLTGRNYFGRQSYRDNKKRQNRKQDLKTQAEQQGGEYGTTRWRGKRGPGSELVASLESMLGSREPGKQSSPRARVSRSHPSLFAMLKAKAKAAATAAKKRAAEQAAQQARQEQAEQQHQTQRVLPSSTLAARRAAANVTQYWVDHQSGTLAPGGGLLRIGYDQAAFERGVLEVVYEPKSEQEWAVEVEKRRRAARGEDILGQIEEGTLDDKAVVESRQEGTNEDKVAPQPTVAVNKEHLAYIVKQLEIPDREAKAALRRHENDLAKALRDLTGPVEPVFRSGTEPPRLVKA